MKLRRWVARHRLECLIFILAVIFYLPAITWGVPLANGPNRSHTWAFDDISPMPAITETYHVFIRDTPTHWVPYPLLHYLTLTLAYGPYLLWLAITGRVGRPAPEYPFGFADPVSAVSNLTIVARLVSVAMAAAAVVVAFRIGRVVWDRRTALLCAAAAFVPYPMFYYAKTGNVEVPYLLWTSLALLFYARMALGGPDIRSAAALGLFAALSTATKDQAAGFFLLMPLLLLNHRRSQKWRKSMIAFVATGAAVYAVASGLALRPSWYRDHIHWVFIGDRSVRIYNDPYPATVLGTLQLFARIPVEFWRWYGPAISVAALAGIFYVAWRERPKLALLWPALSYVCLFLLPLHFFKARYIMPVIFVAGLYAARGLSLGFDWLKANTRAVAVIAAPALALIFTWPVLRSGDLVYQMLHDSRYAATAWLDSAMPPGGTISSCGSFQTMPQLRKDVDIVPLRDLQGAVADVEERRPDFIAVIPDWTGRPGHEYSRMCSELYGDLFSGSLPYEPVARFKTQSLFSETQLLDYPSVNPEVRIFRRKNEPN